MLGFLIRHPKDDGSVTKGIDDKKNNTDNAVGTVDRPVKRQRVADPDGALSPRSGVVNEVGGAEFSEEKLGHWPRWRVRERGRKEDRRQWRQREAEMIDSVGSVVRNGGVVGDENYVIEGQSENEKEREKESERQIRTTDLESAMPSFAETEDVAVKEYEAFRASQQQEEEINVGLAEAKDSESATGTTSRLSDSEDKEGGTDRSKNRWIKGRSSIYVDAFKLALETVLDEEAHLFDERERSIFMAWKELSYEAQYL